jgi:hypothetical protein
MVTLTPAAGEGTREGNASERDKASRAWDTRLYII